MSALSLVNINPLVGNSITTLVELLSAVALYDGSSACIENNLIIKIIATKTIAEITT
jgi:hypothetical protein